jgi:hypothetical protein
MPLSSRPRQLVEGSISSGGSGCGSATTAPAPDAFSRGPFGSVGVGPAVASCWPPPCIAPADVSAAVRSSCSPIAVPQSSSTWWRAVCAAARHASGGGAGSSPSGARPANCRWPRRDALPSRPWVSDTRALDPSCQQLRARRSSPRRPASAGIRSGRCPPVASRCCPPPFSCAAAPTRTRPLTAPGELWMPAVLYRAWRIVSGRGQRGRDSRRSVAAPGNGDRGRVGPAWSG